MKKVPWIIFVVMILGMLVSCATTMQAVGESMIVQRIIEVQGTKSELYRLANEWMAKSFVDSSEVIQYRDKDEGIIVGRGITKQPIGLITFNFWYSLTVEVKENKARVTIEDIYGEYVTGELNITAETEEMRQKEYDELK